MEPDTHLVREQQANGFQALLAAVHIVAQEKVVGLWRETAILEEPQQIGILAMNVSWARVKLQCNSLHASHAST